MWRLKHNLPITTVQRLRHHWRCPDGWCSADGVDASPVTYCRLNCIRTKLYDVPLRVISLLLWLNEVNAHCIMSRSISTIWRDAMKRSPGSTYTFPSVSTRLSIILQYVVVDVNPGGLKHLILLLQPVVSDTVEMFAQGLRKGQAPVIIRLMKRSWNNSRWRPAVSVVISVMPWAYPWPYAGSLYTDWSNVEWYPDDTWWLRVDRCCGNYVFNTVSPHVCDQWKFSLLPMGWYGCGELRSGGETVDRVQM